MGNGAFSVGVLLTIAIGTALFPACSPSASGSTIVTGSGLATSCSTDDDCVGVYFGDVCGFCDLPNASIASSAEAAYQNTVNAAHSHCPPLRATGSCILNQTITTCAMGTCTLTTCSAGVAGPHSCVASTDDAGTEDAGSSGSTVVTGSGLATSCATDDDCVGVYFGDVCGFCDLPNASIASSAETAYQNAVNAAHSRCPPLQGAGSCIGNRAITTCAMGTCTVTTCSTRVASPHACASTSDAGDAGTDD